jgi:phosphatidylinositol-3-phosphatase
MLRIKSLRALGALAVFATVGALGAKADGIKTVFVIAMENHNWTQPTDPFGPGVQQIFQNANAPFINSLVDGSAVVKIDGHEVNISKQAAYAAARVRRSTWSPF